jgi:hypothetical protein
MKSKKIAADEIQKVCEELAEIGLIHDSGRRRTGQVVWVITPLGKLVANLPEDSKH